MIRNHYAHVPVLQCASPTSGRAVTTSSMSASGTCGKNVNDIVTTTVFNEEHDKNNQILGIR